uniref:Uncharacterized protein n=1 Tax=Romanomermis culicivorax TaxID=13658 RepID=A0A915IAZ8_ROMCU
MKLRKKLREPNEHRWDQFHYDFEIDYPNERMLLVFKQKLAFTQDCRYEWTQLKSCMKARYNDYNQLPLLTNDKMNRLQNDIQSCYRSSQCKSPFPSKAILGAKKKCYESIQKNIRNALQSCISYEFSDFDVPVEDESALFIAQLRYNLIQADQSAAVCPSDRQKGKRNDCISKKLSTWFPKAKNQSTQQQALNFEKFCDVRSQCLAGIYRQNLNPDYCYQKYQKGAIPQLCKCAQTLPMIRLLTQYQKCMNSVLNFDANPYQDFGILWLSNTGNRWCANQNDVCSVTALHFYAPRYNKGVVMVGSAQFSPSDSSYPQYNRVKTSSWHTDSGPTIQTSWPTTSWSSSSVSGDQWTTAWNGGSAAQIPAPSSSDNDGGWTTNWSSSGPGWTGGNAIDNSTDLDLTKVFGGIGTSNVFGSLGQIM